MVGRIDFRIWIWWGALSLLIACRTDGQRDIGLNENSWPASFGFGRQARPEEIRRWDISIRPDGRGLPEGRGFAREGAVVFQAKCASCHGTSGFNGPFDPLISHGASSAKTIGNYWPYATTIFDYIRRAMPLNAPGSLSDQEVYQLTAFLLQANGIIDEQQEINAETLPEIVMPAKSLFVPDDRRGGREVR